MDITSLNKDRKKRKPSADMSAIYAKVPPNSRELEDAVLGALLLERNAYERISDIITAEIFYVEANQIIFRAIDHIYKKGENPDLMTLLEELKFREQIEAIGGIVVLPRLTNTVVSTANLEVHARIIYQKYIQRELIRVAGEIIGEAYEDSTDVFDFRDQCEVKIAAIGNVILRSDTQTDYAKKFLSALDERMNEAKMGKIMGITSGYGEIDALTNGWRKKWLITLAAVSSMGKTTFALNLARNAAMAGEPVLVLSREMTVEELYESLVSMETSVTLDSILNGNISDEMRHKKIAQAVDKLIKAPIFIVDATGMTWRQVRATIKQYQKKHGIKMVIEDYVQLSEDEDTKGKNREQQIANITRENKKTAKMLDVAYIQLSQVTSKKLGNQVPTLEDLRESSAIGNDSDIVAIIYRPEYYGIFVDEQGKQTHGKTYIKFVKFRKGKRNAEITLKSNLSIQKFYSPEEGDPIVYGQAKQITAFDTTKKDQQFDEGFIQQNEFK